MTDILDELQRLDAEATKGPWTDEFEYQSSRGDIHAVGHAGEDWIGENMDPQDAALIAAARNALPALVEVARAARSMMREVAALEEAADEAEVDMASSDLHAAEDALRAALARLVRRDPPRPLGPPQTADPARTP